MGANAARQTRANSAPNAASPPAPEGWTCGECGTVNKGKFCTDCGAKSRQARITAATSAAGSLRKKPAAAQVLPRVRDRFDDNDIVK